MQTAYVPIWNKLQQKCYQIQSAFDFGQYMQPISINLIIRLHYGPTNVALKLKITKY